MGIYSSANVYFHQCSGRVDRGGDGVSKAEGGGNRTEEGRYPYNAEATDPSFHAVGCAGSGERGCRGGRR